MKKILFNSLLLFALTSFSQESVNSSGGEISSSAGSISFSVGQIATLPVGSGEQGQVLPGVIRPISIFLLNTAASLKDINIFPNPTIAKINIDQGNEQVTNLNYTLYNISGLKLMSGELRKKMNELDLSRLNADTYFLRIETNSNTTKTYKIVKSH